MTQKAYFWSTKDPCAKQKPCLIPILTSDAYKMIITQRKVRQMDLSTRECFDMGNFRHWEFSARGIFGTWTFRHRDISAPEHFGTWIFWHLAKQYGRFGTDISAPVLLCRNVHVPKCPRAEMFLCRKFLVPKSPRAEKSPCRNVPVLKCPSAGTSAAPNGARAEMFPWWNICAEMTLAKMFRAEMVYRRQMTNLVLNVCFDFFSQDEKQIWK